MAGRRLRITHRTGYRYAAPVVASFNEVRMTPRDAAHKAMQEVSGPIIAISLVLASVFIPLAFIGGVSGQFYSQFAVTIAAAVLISAFNSLTLSPALSAVLLECYQEHMESLA